MAEPKIVSAVGATSGLGRGMRGAMIEQAMGEAVVQAEKDAKAIWERSDLDVPEKQKRIAAIMDPQALLKRKMAARQQAKDDTRAREDAAAKAASKAASAQ